MDGVGNTREAVASAKPRRSGNLVRERVLEVRHYTDKLFSFRTTRDPGFRFESGQFTMIGLEVDGRPLLRAYSMASGVYDEWLEFYSIKVPDGPLTSRLQRIAAGDEILVSAKTTGTLVLSSLAPGRRLLLLGTGTGFAPFASILRDPETYERFESVVVVEGCRTADELTFPTNVVLDVRSHELIGEVTGGLRYYATVTREPFHHQGRIPDLIRTGRLWSDLDAPPLDPAGDRVALCGSPGMLADVRALLDEAGFVEGSSGEPGSFVVEKAFVER
jgi:ferredoxin--NADP+ reductase